MKQAHTFKVLEVLEVVDTRAVEEIDERWVPVAGSGTFNVCERCGREHEVHARVKLEDGSTAIVGTGCMKADGPAVVKALRNAAARATRLAVQRAKVAGLESKLELAETIARAVAALERPEVVRGEISRGEKTIPTISMGGTTLWLTFGERSLEELELSWRGDELAARLKAAGLRSSLYSLRAELEDSRKALKKLEAAGR